METKQRILVVDDYPILLTSWRMLLEAAGFEVVTAEGGALALQTMRETPLYDAVLLDYQMPDMNGLEVLRQIRSDERLQSTRVIMLSASTLHGEESLELGADGFIPKPVDVDRLLTMLGQPGWLERDAISAGGA